MKTENISKEHILSKNGISYTACVQYRQQVLGVLPSQPPQHPTREDACRPSLGEAPELPGAAYVPKSQRQGRGQDNSRPLGGCPLPCSCRGWPAVSCRSWLCDRVNLFPWNCSVTGVSGWATRLCGPAREASWAILTTSPPAEMQKKMALKPLRELCNGSTDDHLSSRTAVW